ncbi:hypothetical protein [Bradyrhizobium valentinum]|uniref:hypothetical protein n=1 Tax=Bradyrhizobium valentinum TaxID=1518501 RepID=UPI00070D1A92|nr:hypothetical protein [Bradyrhizobium valentinum]KRR02323.1 hypothetical protein CQ10_19000 [Bradyrhizobium valentinum]
MINSGVDSCRLLKLAVLRILDQGVKRRKPPDTFGGNQAKFGKLPAQGQYNAPAMIIGERAARFILGKERAA